MEGGIFLEAHLRAIKTSFLIRVQDSPDTEHINTYQVPY